MFDFVSGLITMGFLVASLFFLRFWKRTRDGLFLAFAAAFSLLAVNQAVVALLDIPREELGHVYLLRVLAFGSIIVGIVLKNINSGRSDRA